MLSYSATAVINATPEIVWQILTDAAGYPQWDPGIIRIEGSIVPGGQLTIYSKIAPERAFKPKVTVFEPNRKMVWQSGMPLGLFKGARTFTLTPNAGGGTEFALREEFSGLLLPLIGGSIPDLTQTFQAFVAGLKAAAEKS